MRSINEIFIHCSATKANWMESSTCDQKTAEIRRWHTEERGWSDIGYHFVIDRSGDVCAGRPVNIAGAHAKDHNRNSVGICLVGGFGSDASDGFDENFTGKQRKALCKLLDSLTNDHSGAKIRGHNEVSAKACPGFSVPKFLKDNLNASPKQSKLKSRIRSAVKNWGISPR